MIEDILDEKQINELRLHIHEMLRTLWKNKSKRSLTVIKMYIERCLEELDKKEVEVADEG